MKLNRFVGLAAIALLVVGAMGAVRVSAFAQTVKAPAAQAQATAAPDQAGLAASPDTDLVDEQVGDQTGPDTGVEAAEAPGAEAVGAADTGPNDQDPVLNGSVPVTDTLAEDASEADEAAALAAQAKITVEEAKTAAMAANPGTTVVKAELDNENGSLIYSVELSNGSDVKVDAGNGAILATDAGDANETGGADENGGANETDGDNETGGATGGAATTP